MWRGVIICGCFLNSESIIEGELEPENSHSKDGTFVRPRPLSTDPQALLKTINKIRTSLCCATEMETLASSDTSSGQKRYERPRTNSSSSVEKNRLSGPLGGGIVSGGKFMLQIPVGQQCKKRVNSPFMAHKQ